MGLTLSHSILYNLMIQMIMGQWHLKDNKIFTLSEEYSRYKIIRVMVL